MYQDLTGRSEGDGVPRVVTCENRGETIYLWTHPPGSRAGYEIVVRTNELLEALGIERGRAQP